MFYKKTLKLITLSFIGSGEEKEEVEVKVWAGTGIGEQGKTGNECEELTYTEVKVKKE